MSRRLLVALLLAVAATAGPSPGSVNAAPVSYKLPDETAAFKPGPNLDVVKNNCSACHSADYVKTQPRGAWEEWLALCNGYRADFPWVGPEHADMGGFINSFSFIALGLSYHFVDKYCGQFLCDD